ncbi:MAG: DUF5655 domain-containing protein [Anaerolineales bacterium]
MRSKRSKRGGPRRPLWRCPKCDRKFVNRNQWHSCGRFSVDRHLEGKDASIISVYQRFVRAVRGCGPITLVPIKTRIGFQARITFADIMVRRHWIDCYVILSRRSNNPRFARIESLSRHSHVHHFRVSSPADIDDEVRSWLCQAYRVGLQDHLRNPVKEEGGRQA